MDAYQLRMFAVAQAVQCNSGATDVHGILDAAEQIMRFIVGSSVLTKVQNVPNTQVTVS